MTSPTSSAGPSSIGTPAQNGAAYSFSHGASHASRFQRAASRSATAPEHPERYHLETLRIFCSFLRDQVPLDDDRDGSDGTAVLEMLRALGWLVASRYCI